MLLLGALAGLLAASMVAAREAAPPDTAARRHVASVKDSPGYYPPADPESSSERTGRRLNAPRVGGPFKGGARSLDDLGRSVCRALHHGERDSLLGLCITDGEFRDILWREFPQSRPAVGLTWVDAWKILWARLHAGCMHALRDNGGHYCEFVRFEGDTIARYRNFRLHNRLVLVTRNDLGEVERQRWLRSVAERKGRFKIYSTDD
jgi:hypothetical protein